MNKRLQWIVTTAVLTALLIVAQSITASLGNTLLTGSIVNLILIVSAMSDEIYGGYTRSSGISGAPGIQNASVRTGYATGLSVAAISPVVAKLLGIGPLWSLIPFIILGNIALVLVWRLIATRQFHSKPITYLIAMPVAAVAKFLVLYAGIVRIAIPLLLNLPDPQSAVISKMFSYPQLLTALIGGGLAMIILPMLKRPR